MSNLEDLWLVHDSLAFCMSTNTFNNPAFEQAKLEGHSPSVSIRRASNPSMSEQEQDEEQVVEGALGEGQEDKKPGPDRELGRLESMRKEFAEALNSFCDNIGFSLKSKLFVLELSLKRKLGRLKRFLRIPGALHRVSNNNNNNHHRDASKQFHGADYPAEQWLYWLEREPNSKESLSQQKERILNRLEQVKRASKQRRLEEEREEVGAPVLFNMELNGARWSSAAQLWSGAASSGSGSSKQRPQPRELDNLELEPQPGSKMLRGSRTPQRKPRKPTNRTSKWKRSRQASKYNYYASERAARHGHVPAGAEDYGAQLKLCIICYTNQPNIVTLPCKHHEICSDCFVELIYGAVKHSRFPLKCVLCRQKVERIRCSRRWLLSVIEKSRLLA